MEIGSQLLSIAYKYFDNYRLLIIQINIAEDSKISFKIFSHLFVPDLSKKLNLCNQYIILVRVRVRIRAI